MVFNVVFKYKNIYCMLKLIVLLKKKYLKNWIKFKLIEDFCGFGGKELLVKRRN